LGVENQGKGEPSLENSDIKTGLSVEQKKAFIISVKIGRQIQLDIPEIAIDYVNGLSLNELATKYDIQNRYGITTPKVAAAAVYYALTGFQDKSGKDSSNNYPGLITDADARKIIGAQHQKRQHKILGQRLRDEKKGMFGIPPEQRLEIAKKSGRITYEKRVGVHAKSFEEKSRWAKRAVAARGFRPFSDEEKTLINELIVQPENQRGKAVKAKKVADIINKNLFGGEQVRSGNQIKHFLYAKKRPKKFRGSK